MSASCSRSCHHVTSQGTVANYWQRILLVHKLKPDVDIEPERHIGYRPGTLTSQHLLCLQQLIQTFVRPLASCCRQSLKMLVS